MVGERKFTRLPPESTGDRLQVRHSLIVTYDNLVVANLPVPGEAVSGQTSGVEGALGQIVEDTATTGIAYVTLVESDVETDFTSGENLLNEAGNVWCRVSPTIAREDLFTNASALVSYDNPLVGQKVDTAGAAITRFPLGAPEFDAFGGLRTSAPTEIGEYVFRYDSLSSVFALASGSGGDETYDSTSGMIVLSCPTTSGAFVRKTTDTYHRYQPGTAQRIEMTAVIGDTGKDNVIRRWGYYDSSDGVFFELSGSTFGVVLRDSTGGTVVDTFISQSAWNTDKLDGSNSILNPSNLQLDITKNNIYWIDMQWLGAGSVRFGTFIHGNRQIAHSIHNANSLARPYMRSASRPIRYEQINLNTAASTSELRATCAVVFSEGNYQPKGIINTVTLSGSAPSGTDTYVCSIRPAATFYGRTSHVLMTLESLQVMLTTGSAGTQEANAKLKISSGGPPLLSGDTWTAGPSALVSAMEVDTTATVLYPGFVSNDVLTKGTQLLDLASSQDRSGPQRLIHGAEGDQNPIVFRLSPITSGVVDYQIVLSWKEFLD